MTTPSKSAIRDKLDNVIDPCSEANGSNLSIVEMGLVDEIRLDGDEVTVDMLLTSPHCMMLPAFVDGVNEVVGSLDGVESVEVNFDDGLEWTDDRISADGNQKRKDAMARQMGPPMRNRSDS